jgi:ATP-dependent exoDNAse (exonuclease V) beta subunit
MSSRAFPDPADKRARVEAIDPALSVLVDAPAGSGKTDLLTRRFLRLLAEVDDPAQIVAITFTRAAAAEMRHRILSKIEEAAHSGASTGDEFSMESLAARAVARSRAMGWDLLNLPSLLRVSTIDSFCREVALRQPLLTTLGGNLDVSEEPDALYRRAARRTLEQIGEDAPPALAQAIEKLLEWRDNNWTELEDHLVTMLKKRDRWMQEFWLSDFAREDEALWERLRQKLERPFTRAIEGKLTRLSRLLDRVANVRDEILELARFACEEPGEGSPWALAECAEIPAAPFVDGHGPARDSHEAAARFLQTAQGKWRSERGLNTAGGFPSTPRGRAGKARFASLIARLREIEGLESALAAVAGFPPARYSDEEWEILRAGFTLLHHASGELQVAFAEAGTVDFTAVTQAALRVMRDEDGGPGDAALVLGGDIRHILVDEFQDTSRRQHELVRALLSAWPDQDGRTLFVVGDPKQSIYFFRDADAELFPRVEKFGLDLDDGQNLRLKGLSLEANFRTAPELLAHLNEIFSDVFAADDGSGIRFIGSQPARQGTDGAAAPYGLHLDFVPQNPRGKTQGEDDADRARMEADEARQSQADQIVELIRDREARMEEARARGEAYRIAVLGRSRNVLTPVAAALREAGIPFRAVDLEPLADRPEIRDALSLARALFNPEDRLAWLGVLRAPWCGLTLEDLHRACGADDPELKERPVPSLLREGARFLSSEGRAGVERVLSAADEAARLRAAEPAASLGTWLERVWIRLGGAACVTPAQLVNLKLLWNCLDKLPGGEPDFLSPALGAALDELKAQPDPSAGGERGVQLMTIHKAKGLEFEVVIVPELQAKSGSNRPSMFSWLERGLAEPDESGEITEFLVAPFQTRGADKGTAQAWVDREYRERERQESRRILYVAATRAREELHLFARPAYKSKNGEYELADPAESLLKTAWPALEEEVRARFAEWTSSRTEESRALREGAEILEIAAGAENVTVMPSPAKPAILYRLPAGFQLGSAQTPSAMQGEVAGMGAADLYRRHEGGLLSRALGNAVHALLEELARLRISSDATEAASRLAAALPRISARVRAVGVPIDQALKVAAEALEITLRAAVDPVAEWILAPHADAASEARWTGVIGENLHVVQVDRVFRCGETPCGDGESTWWIVDWKTAHADHLDPRGALPRLREYFAPQLELYGEVLRKLHGPEITIHAGLYYPRMLEFDWWAL